MLSREGSPDLLLCHCRGLLPTHEHLCVEAGRDTNRPSSCASTRLGRSSLDASSSHPPLFSCGWGHQERSTGFSLALVTPGRAEGLWDAFRELWSIRSCQLPCQLAVGALLCVPPVLFLISAHASPVGMLSLGIPVGKAMLPSWLSPLVASIASRSVKDPCGKCTFSGVVSAKVWEVEGLVWKEERRALSSPEAI